MRFLVRGVGNDAQAVLSLTSELENAMKSNNEYKILFISHNPDVLHAPSSALANAGYVITNATLQQTLAKVDTEHFDGVVLCHSLTSREARAVLSLIQSLAQRTPVIQIYSYSCEPVFRFTSPSHDPAGLLSVVGAALQNGSASDPVNRCA
jgi:hypothetical protein